MSSSSIEKSDETAERSPQRDLQSTSASPDAARLLVAIPIAVFMIIDARTASSSSLLFQRHAPKSFTMTLESCSRSAGSCVQYALETVIAIGGYMQRARCACQNRPS
jgi:hypothetical protein